jgi:hypothetical protein
MSEDFDAQKFFDSMQSPKDSYKFATLLLVVWCAPSCSD